MSWTKQQIILEAYDAAGLSSYIFNHEPEDLRSALNKLDAMMASWNATGIYIAYPMTTDPIESSLAMQSNIPDWAIEAAYSNLAIKIAPSHGKSITAELKSTASTSYNNLLIAFAKSGEMEFPSTLPTGAGTRHRKYFQTPEGALQPWEKK